MIYGLQVALRALEPARGQPSRTSPAADFVSESQPTADTAGASSTTTSTPGTPAAVQPATNNQQLATPPTHIPISKQSLLYFLRSRHCATCNAELFPAAELTERPNPGAPPSIIEETRPALPAPNHSGGHSPAEIPADVSGTLPTLNAVASDPGPETSNLEPSTSNLAGCPIHDSPTAMGAERPRNPHSSPALLYTLLGARYP